MATASDPTLSAMQTFDDPSAWDAIIPNVPIFVPHEVDENGRKLKVDTDRLRQIAKKINEKFARHAVAIKFHDGHTKHPSQIEQGKQPRIHAYGIQAKVGRWGPDQQLGLLCTMYVRKGHMDAVRELPFRSAEFYPQTNELTAVALLRADPRLDMGMLFYAKSFPLMTSTKNGPVFCYMENTMPINDPTLQPDEAIDNPELPKNEPDEEDDDLDPEFEKNADRYMKKRYQHLRKYYDNEVCKKYEGDGGGAMPSGTNGFLPGAEDDDKDKNGTMSEYAKRQHPLKYARQMEERVKKLEEQATAANQRAKKSEATQLVRQLQAESYYIPDAHKEIARFMRIGQSEWPDRVEEIRECYQRDPAGGDLLELEPDSPTRLQKEKELTKEETFEIVHYAETNHIDISTDQGFAKAKVEYMRNRN